MTAAGNGRAMNGMFVSEEYGIIDDSTIPDLVQGLEHLGSGSCRTVFDLGDCVLKVNKDLARNMHGSCETESAHWETFQGTDNEYLFAEVLASGDGWLIMVKADSVCTGGEWDYQETMRRATRLGVSDLFSANLGVFDGTCKVIDYATGNVNGCSIVESESCECGSHTCKACYPNGCECCCDRHNYSGCGELSGCNTQECDWCYETATVAFSTLFGFVATNHYGCDGCARENGLQLPTVPVVLKGQGRFVPFNGGTDNGAWFVLDAVTQTLIHKAQETRCPTEPCVCGCSLILN